MTIGRYVHNGRWLPVLTAMVFAFGLLFGIAAATFLQGDLQQGLQGYFQTALLTTGDQGELTRAAVCNNGLTMVKIYLLGLCLLGIPLLMVYLFTKGFAIGFTVTVVSLHGGWQDIGGLLTALVIPKVLFVPLLLLAVSQGMGYSLKLSALCGGELWRDLLRYTVVMALILAAMVFAGLAEGSLTWYGIGRLGGA